jgi:hypothetical protein
MVALAVHINLYSHLHIYSHSHALTTTPTSLFMNTFDRFFRDRPTKSVEGQGQSLSIPKRVPAPLFKYRKGCYGKVGDPSDQAFLVKLENRNGEIIDNWDDYITISTQEPGRAGIGHILDCGAIVLSPDYKDGRLEFTVTAKQKIRKGWKLGIYPTHGNMSQLGQRRCGAGVPGEICGYETTYDDGNRDDPNWLLFNPYSIAPSPTYWEKKESEQILRGGELCTIIAHELPPDEWYAERGLL